MANLTNLLTGTKVLEEVESPINQKIVVLKSFIFGTHIQVGGLTQSGGIVVDIWERTFKKIVKLKAEIKKCLILGLGGGSLVKVIRKFYPKAKITGVDIDYLMVDLGKKYLGLSEKDVEIFIEDAQVYLRKNLKSRKARPKFDLIIVDLYIGDQFPEKFENPQFLVSVKDNLEKGGLAVFNRLYFEEKRSKADKFLSDLQKNFSQVSVFYPQANVMFLCKKV